MLRPRIAAFTLVETVIVVAIIGIVAAIAVPRFSGATSRYRADAAAARLAADVALARQEAINASASRTLTFDYSGKRYTLTGTGALDADGSTYSVDLAAAPYFARAFSGAVNGDVNTPLIFDGFGEPSAAAVFTVAVSDETRTITVDGATGKTQVN